MHVPNTPPEESTRHYSAGHGSRLSMALGGDGPTSNDYIQRGESKMKKMPTVETMLERLRLQESISYLLLVALAKERFVTANEVVQALQSLPDVASPSGERFVFNLGSYEGVDSALETLAKRSWLEKDVNGKLRYKATEFGLVVLSRWEEEMEELLAGFTG